MKWIYNHKKIVIVLLILLLTLIFCSYNTFLSNDDLPYMFFYRGTSRITNIIQVIKNQIADYMNINGRFFIHCIVQTLLIFDKKIWVILNPIVIILLIITIIKNVDIINENKSKMQYIYILLISSLFLLLINYKYIIYWVAGSVNYVWVSLALMLYVYYYLKKGIDNNYIKNSLLIIIISILHEMSLVFMIVLILGTLIYKKIEKKEISKKYLLYIVSIMISSAFVLLSPGNASRMDSNTAWNSLNIFEKIVKSLPVVSRNLLNFKNVLNIIPILYILSIIYKLLKIKDKKSIVLCASLLLVSLLSVIFNNGYIYTLVAILSFLSVAYISYNNKNYKLIIVSLAFYAIVYSTIIVPNYADGRPNFFFYIFNMMIISSYLSSLMSKKSIKLIIICLFAFTITKEIYFYNEIGTIYKERKLIIAECKKDECETIRLPEIPSKFRYYHIDINQPKDKSYYTYRYFLQYYNLPNDIVIEYYKK